MGRGATAGRRRVTLLLPTVAAVLVIGGAQAATEPSAARMVLKASDLPPGFVVDRAGTGVRTNAAVIREHGPRVAPQLRQWGRITGYAAHYVQRDPIRGELPGVTDFAAFVSLFRTARGAQSALGAAGAGCRGTGMVRVPLGSNPPVGPATLVCTRRYLIRGERMRLFGVQWRNRTAIGYVVVGHFEGAVTAQAALLAGYQQNRRMTAELGRREAFAYSTAATP